MVNDGEKTPAFVHPGVAGEGRIKIFLRVKKETSDKLDSYAKKTKLKKGEIIDRLVESLMA